MRTSSRLVLGWIMSTLISVVISSTIVTRQYKTYGSSMYAGDQSTCTDSNILATELERGEEIIILQ